MVVPPFHLEARVEPSDHVVIEVVLLSDVGLLFAFSGHVKGGVH